MVYGGSTKRAVRQWRVQMYVRGLISTDEEESGKFDLKGGSRLVKYLGQGHAWAGHKTHRLAEEFCRLSRRMIEQ